jgi:hypothetical protein
MEKRIYRHNTLSQVKNLYFCKCYWKMFVVVMMIYIFWKGPIWRSGLQHHHHQWLYSPCKDLGRLTLRFRNIDKILIRTPLDECSARRKGLYPHRTTQHRNTKTNIHASKGIRTHDSSNQAAKTYALDRAATGTGGLQNQVTLTMEAVCSSESACKPTQRYNLEGRWHFPVFLDEDITYCTVHEGSVLPKCTSRKS